MANEALRAIIQHLHRVAALQSPGRPTDAELLERFAVARDQAAFEVLVWRHGPMVLNLCRRLLRHEHDAEDAFQATFLTLVRKAGSIAKREAVGSWLYKVAYRVALEANAQNRERAARETTGVEWLAAKPAHDAAACELELAVTEEVSRLPVKYRLPLVLCCFEGKTSQEVARQIGCPEATVRTRLARARQRLRMRLARRGLAVCAGVLATGSVPNAASAVSAALADATIRAARQFATGKAAAGGIVSMHAVELAERVLKFMFLNKLKQVATVVVLGCVFSAGAGLSIHQALADKPAGQEREDAPKPGPKEVTQPKDDRTEIRGTWVTWHTVTRSTNREVFPPEQIKATYVFTDDKIMRVGDEGFLRREPQTFKLDPTQRPKTIDSTDRVTGTVLLGIYELEGDTLKILYDREKRPTEFTTNPFKPTIYKRVSRTFAPVAQRYANAPGCFWISEPGDPGGAFSLGGVGMSYIYDKGPDGAAHVTLAYLTPDFKSREYRPVLLDAGGKRHLPKIDFGSAAGRRGEGIVALYRWRMDPNVLPAEKVAKVGIEALTPESRLIASREALERARIANIDVLPWPQPGQAYSFTLTTIDGRRIRSDDLRGKVVVLDCWAANSVQSIGTIIPELKAMYEKWHHRSLEIVGISFDRDVESVHRVCKSKGMSWPQVWVPDDERIRELWREASGIEGDSRVLIIDQQGILQAESPGKLEEKVAKLLDISPDKPSAKPKP